MYYFSSVDNCQLTRSIRLTEAMLEGPSMRNPEMHRKVLSPERPRCLSGERTFRDISGQRMALQASPLPMSRYRRRRAEREEKWGRILERKGFWWGSGDSRELMVLVMGDGKLEVNDGF